MGGPVVTEHPCRLRSVDGSLHETYGVTYTSTKHALPGRWLNCRNYALDAALVTKHDSDTI